MTCAVVGEVVGVPVGLVVGALLGLVVGLFVGLFVGFSDFLSENNSLQEFGVHTIPSLSNRSYEISEYIETSLEISEKISSEDLYSNFEEPIAFAI